MVLRKRLEIICLLVGILLSYKASSTNFYLSNSGNDANIGNSPGSPWKSLNKLNSYQNFKPGDNILFMRGNTFYGSIRIKNSGIAGSPIIFNSYGTGDQPVITGFIRLDSWRPVNDTVQKSTVALKTHPEMITIDGVPRGRGRYPNSGYLSYESFVKDYSLTDNQLRGTPNWTGAEVVIRGDGWYLTRNLITEHKDTRIAYAAAQPGSSMKANFGYFIQNSYKTLDSIGEWYYNGKDLQMYFGKTGYSPNQHVIKVSTIDTLIYINKQSNILFNNICFEGADMGAMYLDLTSNITIQNCSFNYSGRTAIVNKGTHFTTINNCRFNHTYNIAISHEGPYSYKGPLGEVGLPDHELITGNIIKNTGVIAGTGVFEKGGNYDGPGDAIQLNGSDHIIEKNIIDSVGHSGISFAHGKAIIRFNQVDHFALTRNDAGGIYTVLSDSDNTLLQSNIILNGIGNAGGMNGETYLDIHGLYFDNYSKGITARGNSVANMHDCGIYGQSSHDLNIEDNTIYNCKYAEVYLREIVSFTGYLVRNVNLRRNIFFSKDTKTRVMQFWTNGLTMPNFGHCDSNYYACPINDNITMTTGTLAGFVGRTLAGWKSYTGQDANSKKSPKSIVNTSDLRFEYNPGSTVKVVQLGYNYIDVKGVVYNGSVSIAPYSSVILLKNGASTSNTRVSGKAYDQTETNSLVDLNEIKVYPTIVRDFSTIEITRKNSIAAIKVIVSDFTGKVMFKKDLASRQSKMLERINTSGYARGTYTITVVFSEGEPITGKIIKL